MKIYSPYKRLIGIMNRNSNGSLGLQTMGRFSLAVERLRMLDIFDSEFYRNENPDIGGFEPEYHFIAYGGTEGRKAARPRDLARALGRIHQNIDSKKNNINPKNKPSIQTNFPIGVYCSSFGNGFMQDIAEGLAFSLRAAGATVRCGDEKSPIEDRPKISIFVAPHEFFILGDGPKWVRDDVFVDACVYCTEQLQTQWFWRTLPYVLMARCAIDTSQAVAEVLGKVMPAGHILPATNSKFATLTDSERAHPLLAAQNWWMKGDDGGERNFDERPLDISFFGADSVVRDEFFTRNAELLNQFEALIYLRKRKAGSVVSHREDGGSLTDIAAYVARRSRIALNVHRDEFPYFEWHRMVHQGMANGALVLSDPCFSDGQFKPGVHYLEEEPRRIGQIIEWILNTQDGRDTARNVVANATTFIADTRNPPVIGEELMYFLTEKGGFR